MYSDELTEIPKSDWSTLRDLYLMNWPTNLLGYQTVDNYIQWIKKRPTIKHLNIYSLSGDWLDGTFVVIDRDLLIPNTLNESNERLIKLISLIDLNHRFVFANVRKRHRSAVLEVTKAKQLRWLIDNESHFYYKPKEESRHLKICIPEGITIGNLSSEQVEIVDSVWFAKSARSLNYLQRLAELNTNVSLTNAGKLVAWCLRLPTGPLSMLQVDEDYKRRGLGTLTLKLMAKKLAESGHDACACVLLNNIASHEIFQKNGFKVIDNVFFTTIEQTVPFEFELN